MGVVVEGGDVGGLGLGLDGLFELGDNGIVIGETGLLFADDGRLNGIGIFDGHAFHGMILAYDFYEAELYSKERGRL
jgi:hypothetical protein